MYKTIITWSCIWFAIPVLFSQPWMTDLAIAQRLALVENKMVFMVWEGTTAYAYPVWVNDNKGRRVFIENLYTDEAISPLIWEHFVPVIVNEDQYGILLAKLRGKRSQKYIEKFNDNSIKIMDVHGNLLNADDYYTEDLQNISTIIKKYALNTKFITPELQGYLTKRNYYSAYYLASKYIDFSMYAPEKLRTDLLRLSSIYNDEAQAFANKEGSAVRSVLLQRCHLLRLQEYLVLKRPKRTLRALKKMGASKADNANNSLIAFLYYTAYMSQGEFDKAKPWKSQVSSVNLKKAELIINLNS